MSSTTKTDDSNLTIYLAMQFQTELKDKKGKEKICAFVRVRVWVPIHLCLWKIEKCKSVTFILDLFSSLSEEISG